MIIQFLRNNFQFSISTCPNAFYIHRIISNDLIRRWNNLVLCILKHTSSDSKRYDTPKIPKPNGTVVIASKKGDAPAILAQNIDFQFLPTRSLVQRQRPDIDTIKQSNVRFSCHIYANLNASHRSFQVCKWKSCMCICASCIDCIACAIPFAAILHNFNLFVNGKWPQGVWTLISGAYTDSTLSATSQVVKGGFIS